MEKIQFHSCRGFRFKCASGHLGWFCGMLHTHIHKAYREDKTSPLNNNLFPHKISEDFQSNIIIQNLIHTLYNSFQQVYIIQAQIEQDKIKTISRIGKTFCANTITACFVLCICISAFGEFSTKTRFDFTGRSSMSMMRMMMTK